MTKKKIIYINYMNQFGHITFDTIQIQAMLTQGYEVKLVMHEAIAKQMRFNKDHFELILPKWMGRECKSSLKNRMLFLITLLYIKFKITFKEFDYCVVSNIDEITMGLLPLTSNMFLFCHGCCKGLYNPIKFFFLKKLSKKNTFIVFNKEMANAFIQHKINEVKIISHGCRPSFSYQKKSCWHSKLEGYKHLVFHPSSKTEECFIKEIYNQEYNQELKHQNTLLLLRGNHINEKGLSNIKIIHTMLSRDDYEYIFLKADIILLVYPPSFHLQVSGVSFECVANQKKILASHNKSLEYCKKFYNYNPFFKDGNELIQKIQMLNENQALKPIVKPEEITPNYKHFFTKIIK